MTAASPDPKPLTDDLRHIKAKCLSVIGDDRAGNAALQVANYLLSALDSLATITTLRASLGEAEKRAEEAERRHADKDAAYLRAMAREVSADDRTATVLEKLNEVVAEKRASEGLVAVLREALEKARIVFAGYTQLHLRKSPPDMVKGLRNKELADMCLAALSTTPATRTLGRTPWQSMDTAPTDGTPFYSLEICCVVGVGLPWRTDVRLRILRRDERGYWFDWFYNRQIADSQSGNFWAPLSALPIADYWKSVEAQRIKDGGEPFDIPEPYGTGVAITRPAAAGEGT